MYPYLKPGDHLVVKHVPPNSLKVGDIIAIPQENHAHFMVHRLIKLFPNDTGLTKGDASLKADYEEVKLSNVEGKVMAILRGRRLISISTGFRSKIRGLYARLSWMGLTYGAIKLKAKNFLMPVFTARRPKNPNLERSFILSILREDPPEDLLNLDWTNLTKLAYKEGVAGILYPYLKDSDIPQQVLSTFEDYYYNTAYLNLIHIHTLEKLEQALRDEKLEVLTLKGASLLDRIYPKVGIRFMEDLDLMVHANDYERFVNLLHRLGFKREGLLSHLFVKDKVAIDLHTHALHTDRIKARHFLFPEGMEPVWASAKPWKPGFRWLKRPEDADNVLLLSQHLMQHSFSRLIWFEDIWRLLKERDDLFWGKLRGKADFLKQHKSLSFTLYLLKGLFDFVPPQGSGLNPLLENISDFERVLLNIYTKAQSVHRLGLFLRVFCISGFRDRIRFGSETLLPKKEVLEQEFGRSSIIGRAFFYFLRVFQMGGLLIRLICLIPGAMIRSTR